MSTSGGLYGDSTADEMERAIRAATPNLATPMDHHEKSRIRAAAFRSTRLYPGPVGELIARELLSWEEFGYRLGGDSLIMRLVDTIMKTELDYTNGQ